MQPSGGLAYDWLWWRRLLCIRGSCSQHRPRSTLVCWFLDQSKPTPHKQQSDWLSKHQRYMETCPVYNLLLTISLLIAVIIITVVVWSGPILDLTVVVSSKSPVSSASVPSTAVPAAWPFFCVLLRQSSYLYLAGRSPLSLQVRIRQLSHFSSDSRIDNNNTCFTELRNFLRIFIFFTFYSNLISCSPQEYTTLPLPVLVIFTLSSFSRHFQATKKSSLPSRPRLFPQYTLPISRPKLLPQLHPNNFTPAPQQFPYQFQSSPTPSVFCIISTLFRIISFPQKLPFLFCFVLFLPSRNYPVPGISTSPSTVRSTTVLQYHFQY